jgi:glutathione S-transferase
LAKIVLYTQARNPFSEKVAGGLQLKRLEFEVVETEDEEERRRLNPETGLLPVLEIDGARYWDSTPILFKLDELFPEHPLTSAEPKAAAAQRQLASWSDSSFAFFWNRWLRARDALEAEVPPTGPLARLRQGVARAFQGSSSAEKAQREVLSQLRERIDDLVGFLGQRPFFHADQPSLADLSVYGMLRVVRDGPIPGMQAFLATRPTMVAYMERMEELLGPSTH